MKRIISLFLVLCFILSATACQENNPPTEAVESTTAATAETAEATEEQETFIAVPEPLTWDRINALPIASSEMSSDELRQLCVDYMRLQLSFQWTPNDDFSYIIETYNKPIGFHVGQVYAGLPYNGPDGGPSGNIYTMMEYYDPETGVLDVATLGTERISEIISNHCSTSPFWAWARVVNTMRHYKSTSAKNGFSNGKMNKHFGFLPVAPCDYEGHENWYADSGTKEVCYYTNGRQTIYEAYANTLLADGCITLYKHEDGSYSNHIVMISKDPIVVRNSDGTINGEKSYLFLCEQTSSPASDTTSAGDKVTIVGRVDSQVSFRRMFDQCYVPFTFAEFLGTDPVEDGNVTLEFAKKGALDYAKIATSTLQANYPISNIYITVTDKSGDTVYTCNTTPYAINSSSVRMNTIPNFNSSCKEYFVAGNHITIDVRLSTGAVLNVLDADI